jgi:GTP cyclohydrolase I
MSALMEKALADVQASPDTRGVALDQVGIVGLRYPATVELADGTRQGTVCEARLSVSLAADVRGTHMSRFVEVLHKRREALSPAAILSIARELAVRLDAERATIELTFPLFVPRAAPITGQEALLGIDCTLAAYAGQLGTAVQVGARVPVTSLCPCSKEISDYSAHSQRGYVKIDVVDRCWMDGARGLWPEELMSICDQAASAPIYPVLKRADERHVTMLAYDRPAFVEDLAREVALALQSDDRVTSFDLEVVNQESIHDHQALARLAWRRS